MSPDLTYPWLHLSSFQLAEIKISKEPQLFKLNPASAAKPFIWIPLQKALDERGWKPTPVQQVTQDEISSGGDRLVVAPTGSGKTYGHSIYM